MAKEPRSLTGKVVAITGGGRGIGRAIAAGAGARGRPRGRRRPRPRVGRADRRRARRARARAWPLDVTDHAGFTAFLDEVEQRLGPLDVLVNNAGIMPVTPLRRGERGQHRPPARPQPARRHPRHAGGDAPDGPARHRPHRQPLVDRRPQRLPVPGHLLRHQARRGRAVGGRARGAARHRRRGVRGHAERRAHRADDRPRRLAREGGRARGRRRRGRRRAEEAALRRLRPALQRPAGPDHEPAAAPLARGDRPLAQGRQSLLDADRSARAEYEARAAASAPAAGARRAPPV